MNILSRFSPKRNASGLPPKIGLALGGGGVRGLAHAGILSVFERAKLPIQAIAGSSMGAIVAAAYTLNPDYSKEMLIDIISELDDAVPRSYESPENDSILNRFRQFIDLEKYILSNITGWGIFPDTLAMEALEKIAPGKDLGEASIPIAVVATDLISGKKVVFKDGPALFALRASSALPGYFTPVHRPGQLLVDGAIIDVVPVDVVRKMGVDMVIAIDVEQGNDQVEINNGLEAFLRSVELCSVHYKQYHLSKADLVINPFFGEAVSTFDVKKSSLCIEAGVRAAEVALPLIKEMLRSR